MEIQMNPIPPAGWASLCPSRHIRDKPLSWFGMLLNFVILGSYATLISVYYMFLFVTRYQRVVGRTTTGSRNDNGSVGLEYGAKWSTGGPDTFTNLPILLANSSRCFPIREHGCFKISKTSYWFKKSLVTKPSISCGAEACEARAFIKINTTAGLSVELKSPVSTILRRRCENNVEFRELKGDAKRSCRTKIWYTQIFLQVKYKEKLTKGSQASAREITLYEPLLDQQCRAQLIFGFLTELSPLQKRMRMMRGLKF